MQIKRNAEGYVVEASMKEIPFTELPQKFASTLKKAYLTSYIKSITYDPDWGELGYGVALEVDSLDPGHMEILSKAKISIFAMRKGAFGLTMS